MPTNHTVYWEGEEFDNWRCDINPETGDVESNGGVERTIEYAGRLYSVVTDAEGEVLLDPQGEAQCIHADDTTTTTE